MSFFHAFSPEVTVKTVSVRAVIDWLVWGWQAFMRTPAQWVWQALVLILVLGAIGFVPLIGWAVVIVVFPMLVGGMVYAVACQEQGQSVTVRMLFHGFSAHPAALAMVGVCHFAGALVALIIATVIGGSAALTGYLIGALAGFGLAIGGVVLATVVFSVLWVIILMAFWFAPALVVMRKMEAFEAIRLSLKASFANLLPLGVLAVILYVLVWIAMLPAGLGMLVLSPVVAAALYQASKHIFQDNPALPEVLPPETQAPPESPPSVSLSKEP
jgi:uncharacterized membrane protein